jgi:hypothetical protein
MITFCGRLAAVGGGDTVISESDIAGLWRPP